jgi:hypothetical protein
LSDGDQQYRWKVRLCYLKIIRTKKGKEDITIHYPRDVATFFKENFPKIGKKLNDRTLQRWHQHLVHKKTNGNFIGPQPRKGQPPLFASELIESLLDIIRKLGVAGTPLNLAIVRGIIQGLLKESGKEKFLVIVKT